MKIIILLRFVQYIIPKKVDFRKGPHTKNGEVGVKKIICFKDIIGSR